MGSIKVYPNKLQGEVNIPPSKSMAHRAIICAALSDGSSIVDNIDLSDDMIATIDGMRALGAIINVKEGYLEIKGLNSEEANETREFERVIDCNESGSTLRFIIPVALTHEGTSRFVGKGNLGKRPLDIYYEIFEKQGIEYSKKPDNLDLVVKGALKGGEFKVKGNVSSQFISGLMFALPLLNEDSKIIITTELESKGYIDLTLSVMKDFGIEIINKNYKEFIIKGNQMYSSTLYRVEGDYSQGAFFLCADALGSKVVVRDLKEESLQGDSEVIDILKKLGAAIGKSGNNIIAYEKLLRGYKIDGAQCPDIIPILAGVATLAKGRTEFINIGRLRIKECDRLSAVAIELRKLGAKIEELEDGLIIDGVEELKGGCEVWSHKDHRIAMMLAIMATRCRFPIVIKDYECVSKSYPNFFKDFVSLGGEANEWSMGE
ncbi:MAG: 3-phosphoshikimate 1-carboxyvinyltransferase [Clostridium sp.]